MIETEPIPAGENNYIKLCLIEDDYRIRVTDLFGNIYFELTSSEINKFHTSFTQLLLGIQQLKTLDEKKDQIKQAMKNNKPLESVKNTKIESVQTVSLVAGGSITSEIVESQGEPLALIDQHVRLTTEELDMCVKALKSERRLSRKITIEGEDLEQYILQAFDGKKITINKIVNQSASCFISVVAISVRKILDALVQEGKVTSTIEKIKGGNVKYTLYAVNYSPKVQKSSMDILLEKLDEEFTTEHFLEVARKTGIEEHVALNMLEQSHATGELLQPRPQLYKKIP